MMNSIPQQGGLGERIKPGMITVPQSHPGAEREAGEMRCEETGQSDFYSRLAMGRNEEGRADPDPLQGGKQGRTTAEPLQEHIGSRGMGVDSREIKVLRGDNFFEKPARFRNFGHVAPDSLGLAIPGPVKSHRPEARACQQRGGPVMPGGMITQAMEDQNDPFFRPGRVPLAQPNVLP